MYSDCNNEQKIAITHISGPLVVCAGAGSGKTRVIAYRVAHLVQVLGYDPASILCVTFTNKAAREMRERITMLLEDKKRIPLITTFHGYGLYMLRRFGGLINLKTYSIIDEDVQKQIITDILKEINISTKEVTPKQCLSYIGLVKNNMSLSGFSQLNYKTDIYDSVYHIYQNKKREANYIDFDDILIYTLQLLKIQQVQNTIQKETRNVLVDEYQDTNTVQHEIIKYITIAKDKFGIDSLCVVGDEDQSIYSWRGANVDNITHFKRDYPDAQLVTLSRNYRSAQEILNLANVVIEKNNNRNPKKLWTDKQSNNAVSLIEYSTGYAESNSVINIIKKLKQKNNNESIAILYRSHYQSRLFEEACVTDSIPYKVFGGINFYERQEIKDILSYAKIIVNSKDRYSFQRAAQVPSRGIGDAFFESFFNFWNEHPECGISEILREYLDTQKIGPKIRDNLEKFYALIIHLISHQLSAKESLNYIITTINYYNYLLSQPESHEEIASRRENIEELLVAADVFDQLYQGNLADFIDHIAIMYEKHDDNEHKSDTILLMTLHAAKGLEFSSVFLVGLEDGIFPSYRAMPDTAEFEEERRLLYVGITRARERLFCSYAKQRNLWGSTRSQHASSFLKDFTSHHAFFNAAEMPSYMLNRFINQLLEFEQQTFNIAKQQESTESLQSAISKKQGSEYSPQDIVQHEVFGVGRVVTTEREFCSVLFSNGLKKIKTSFLKKAS
jgi:DNA helicase-2/ATP-dependent DNA helicase PcrA